MAVQAAPAAQDDRPQTADQITEKVPGSLANAFRALHGADVSGVPVRRGRAVARQAARLDAAAFTRDGVVYLPDAAGSLNQAGAGALLAHELTHVVQQRMLGSALPSEASPQGQALEAQALATQQWFLGGTGTVPPLAMLPGIAAATPARAPLMRHLHLAPSASTGESAATLAAPFPANSAAEPGVQRQPVDTAGSTPTTEAASWAAAFGWPTGHEGHSAPDLAGASQDAGMPEAVSEAIAGAHTAIAEQGTQLAELAGRRHFDLDNPVELDELATRLYGRLRSKLRLELIVDRERAGLLTDFR
jgi:Domain of unknown function (DUF4157)